MTRPVAMLAASASIMALAACGTSGGTSGPIVLSGSLSGVLQAGPPSSCGPGWTLVSGPYGSATTQVADLKVNDDGSIKVDAGPVKGTYSGSGVSFVPGQGWDIDADLVSDLGAKRLHVRGHLGC